MAEQEIIKHVKAAIEAGRDRQKSWRHRIREILLEVAIIVFAVSLSIWLHGWAEGLKDRREEREFLTGLKEDLEADMKEMRSDLQWHRNALAGLRYFERVGAGEPLNADSMSHYQWVLFSYTQIEPRVSRFEALKGSGRMNIIENKELLLAITDIYTKDFPLIRRRNDYFNALKDNRIGPFVISRIRLDASGKGMNWQEILRDPGMRIMLGQGPTENVMEAYEKGLAACEKVVGEIEREGR
jgi:hypothetical protein